MSVPEQIPTVSYTANGTTTNFPITFELSDERYLVVTKNMEIPPVGAYTVLNGNVVFGVAPNEGDIITLMRDTVLDRETNYQNYDNSFRPEAVNYDLDKIWHVLQEQNLIDAKLLARLKEEIEWRRTHDANFDELTLMRDSQIFSGLKQYVDTYIAATNPNIFGGVTAGIVFALDQKSVQTHLDILYQELVDARQAIDDEESRATNAEALLQQSILNETIRATGVESSLQTQINVLGVGNKAYLTYADMDADKLNIPAKSKVTVTNDATVSNNGDWQWDGVAFTKSAYDPLTQAKAYTLEIVRPPEMFSNQAAYKENGKIKVSTSNGTFYQKVSVRAGEKFLVKSIDYNISKAWYLVDENENVIDECKGFTELSSEIVTIKSGAEYLYANCPNSEISNFKLEKLSTYEHKTLDLSGDYPLEVGIAYISDNAERAKAVRVGSPQVTSMVIRVNEGDKFKIDARKIGTVKSYYFVAEDFTIVSSESDNEPDLKFVTVPQYATKLIVCSDNSYNFSVLKANYFDVLAYEASIKPEPSVKKNLEDFYPQQPNYKGLLKEKCPNFYSKFRQKNGDVCVVITGTSLTQGNLYATDRADATTRPPLLHTNDLASHIFDSLIQYWHGQQYRRYDHPDLTYSSSSWSVINTLKDGSNNDVWDDFDYKKNGLTKTTTSANASVSTVIPVGAWQFNFIYRSDSQSGNCTVSIAEGNSKVEVFNGTAWVEANGYAFSMLESAATETKGNTCYQKRLKMRCKNKVNGGIDSLATAKNITISKGNNANRFNVVGFEWSPREYMLTFINAARGSHAWGLTDSPVNLENYQDTDVWEFKPDLILCEVTAINWGAGFGQALKTDPNYYVNIAKKAYFDDLGAGWTTSLYNTSEQYTKCEIIFYGDTVATSVDYDTLWDANKQPKFGLVESAAFNGSGSTENVGRVKTIFENYEAVELYMQSKPYVFIPVVYQFKKLADDAFGNYPDAFAPTLADGDSLSFDRVHLNDNGAAFYAYLIKPLFDNL